MLRRPFSAITCVCVVLACAEAHPPEATAVTATAANDTDDADDEAAEDAPTADDDDDAPTGDGDEVSSASGPEPGSSSDASTTDTTDATDGIPLDPPAGGSSGGSGGGPADAELRMTASGVIYRMIAPADPGPLPFLLVYSGTEGSQPMSINLLSFAASTGTSGFAFAVLHGVEYYGDTQAGIDVMDEVRALYDIDNDRTYLLSESAGTVTGLELGLHLRQSWFAAYWANDVNTSAVPTMTADELGFAPWGNAGPGGQFELAGAIVDGMAAAGYRTPEPSPYDGPGAGAHGDLEQLVAAISWFPGKTRQ